MHLVLPKWLRGYPGKLKLPVLAFLSVATASAVPPSAHLGLQLWSLRAQFKENVPDTLKLAESFGFKLVETAGTYGLTPEDFRAQMQIHGLKPVSAHFGYDLLDGNLPGVIAQAKALGVDYIVVPVIPHHPLHFGVEEARVAAAKFNTWAAVIRANGMKFAYHTHGYEFQTGANGGETPFDVLVQSTRPDLVDFEMDVFWVAHAGVDPVKLLGQYSGRWKMLHLKDLRPGAPTDNSGAAPATDDVAVGPGRIPLARGVRRGSSGRRCLLLYRG